MNASSTIRTTAPAGRRTFSRRLLTAAAACAALAAMGTVLEPEHALPGIHLANIYLMSLGLAGGVFIALQHVANAGWSVGFRRVPEAMTVVLPISGTVLLLTLLGAGTLFEWTRTGIMAHDHVLAAKQGWLNLPFFSARSAVYILLWILLIGAMVRLSRRQDADGHVRHTFGARKYAAAFLGVFGVTFTLASVDWIMSLQPHWFSTIFGIYNISGLLVNGLAAITMIVIVLRRNGILRNVVNESHLHDLGKLLFAFSTFWMYIWFSQYMLIWYANIPEELSFFTVRLAGGWRTFTLINVAFNWVIPFVTLLPVWTKRREGVLLRICAVLMIGHWIDLYWMMMPPSRPASPAVGIWDLAPMAAALLGFFGLVGAAMARHRAVPVNDPYLVESLHHHQ